ncbi:MAG TPA: heat-shock protein Hsp20 [Candidatus Accumulibacter sp.]|jgi:HSP20 family protein|nr:heat-shock protein Hsp20 [Accumulibacter sp.]
MLYRSFFPRDLFADLDRLQREMQQNFEISPSIRGLTRGFPAMNVGSTPKSVEIYAFAPGIAPEALEVHVEKGVLTVAGERKLEAVPDKATAHIDERFTGRFRRIVSLPDDVDATAVEARYRDGVLHISIPRKEAAQPQRISIQ